MNTNYEKDFVPYEQALALKELGFDEPCLMAYIGKGNQLYSKCDDVLHLNAIDVLNPLKAPTFSQAFRWFRDKKLSDSYIYRYQKTDGSINYGYSITNDYGIEETRFIKENYTSYEEAELACLRKLIEIVKQQQS